MLRKLKTSYRKLGSKIFSFPINLSTESIVWAYRLFLDRDPESALVVAEKLKWLSTTQDIRQEFINSEEFLQKNPGVLFLSLSGNEPPMLIEEASDLQRLFFHIQNVWEHLGETEPYWSVATFDRFKVSKINETRHEFYNLGGRNVETLFQTLERNGIEYTSFKTCLEYGCGLGRVTCWLAKRFENVLAYDISKSHLQLAEQYLSESSIQNVRLKHISKPQQLGNFPKVDVVYSVIVLQHNPPPIIRLIIQELIRALRPGGVAFFQVPTYRLGYRFSLEEYLSGEARKGRMEMHVLPQKEVFEIVNREQGRLVEVLEDDCAGLRYGERSNTFVVQKQ
jgi:2-polyprenyl-3-methyl-5-hydroxy-6-metoxy-1,4-benzoquinol methylase